MAVSQQTVLPDVGIQPTSSGLPTPAHPQSADVSYLPIPTPRGVDAPSVADVELNAAPATRKHLVTLCRDTVVTTPVARSRPAKPAAQDGSACGPTRVLKP